VSFPQDIHPEDLSWEDRTTQTKYVCEKKSCCLRDHCAIVSAFKDVVAEEKYNLI